MRNLFSRFRTSESGGMSSVFVLHLAYMAIPVYFSFQLLSHQLKMDVSDLALEFCRNIARIF